VKKFLIFLCGLVMIFGFAGATGATVLTFDDISAAQTGTIADGYGGLDWDNMGYLNGSSHAPGSGYDNGTVSGDYVAANLWASVATVSDSLFDFNGAFFTGAWNDGLNINIQGLNNGSAIFNTTIQVDHYGPTWFEANFVGIDQLVFNSYGGTHVVTGGAGEHFAMDNFTFNETAPVPEPSTILLMGAGLLGLVGYNRKRSNKKC